MRKTGMDTKKPATAQIRVTAESFKNFLILNINEKMGLKPDEVINKHGIEVCVHV